MNRQVLLNLKKAVNFAEAGLELQNLTLLEKEMYYGVLERFLLILDRCGIPTGAIL